MPERETTLDTAAFLDSPQARALIAAGLGRPDVLRVVRLFLGFAYDGVGRAPRLLDADSVHEILGHLMPGRFGKSEPIVPQVVPILRAYLEFLIESAHVPQAFEMQQSLERTEPVFLEAVRSGVPHVHGHAPQKPFVHRAEKTGRNDTCPCGSGKKFKRCCMTL